MNLCVCVCVCVFCFVFFCISQGKKLIQESFKNKLDLSEAQIKIWLTVK